MLTNAVSIARGTVRLSRPALALFSSSTRSLHYSHTARYPPAQPAINVFDKLTLDHDGKASETTHLGHRLALLEKHCAHKVAYMGDLEPHVRYAFREGEDERLMKLVDPTELDWLKLRGLIAKACLRRFLTLANEAGSLTLQDCEAIVSRVRAKDLCYAWGSDLTISKFLTDYTPSVPLSRLASKAQPSLDDFLSERYSKQHLLFACATGLYHYFRSSEWLAGAGRAAWPTFSRTGMHEVLTTTFETMEYTWHAKANGLAKPMVKALVESVADDAFSA